MNSLKSMAALLVATFAGAGAASAATVYYGEISGNDPFPESFLGSPALAKCDQSGGTGECTTWEDAATSRGGAEGDYSGAFSLTFLDNQSFSWSFDSSLVTDTLSVLSPTYIAVKASNKYQVFQVTQSDASGFADISAYQRNAISHVSFYDGGGVTPTPLPAAGLLLIGGLGAMAAFKRRKSA